MGIGLLVFCLPARADWQNTKWGMAPEPLAKATGATLDNDAGVKPVNDPAALVYSGSYSTGDYHFSSHFYFQDGKLNMIRLAMPNADKATCYALRIDLEGKYGRPFDEPRLNGVLQLERWNNAATNDQVNWTFAGLEGSNLPMMCELQYKPLVTERAKGL